MTANSVKKLLEKIEGNRFVSDKFHFSTNNKKLDTTNIKNVPRSWTKIHFKTYPRFDKIYFNSMKIPNTKLRGIINRRRSIRQFTGLPISKNELYYLLSSSSGLINLNEAPRAKSPRFLSENASFQVSFIRGLKDHGFRLAENKSIDNSRRPYPSAGARYPLEVYPLIQNCSGIEKGLYHYNVKENVLGLLLAEDLGKWLIRITGGEKWIEKAAIVFVITGALDRTRVKYGDRGYRYVLLEAGHLGQNLCLLATELGFGSCPVGGYIDNEVNKLLDINLQKEVVLYLIAVGKV